MPSRWAYRRPPSVGGETETSFGEMGLPRSPEVQASAVCVSAPSPIPFGQVFPKGRAEPRRLPTVEPFLPLNESSGNRLEVCQEGLG